jgi:hypothetical protein
MNDERCAICRFFNEEKLSEENEGVCRRGAPVRIWRYVRHGIPIELQFPIINMDQWCGEFEIDDIFDGIGVGGGR